MDYIYVCAPYDGLEENYIKALNYCKYVKAKGKTPICPVTMYHGVYDDRITEEHIAAKKVGQELLKLCSEVWVFGINGNTEVNTLSSAGKLIRYIEDSFSFNARSETLSVLMNEFQMQTGRLINRAIMENIVFYLDAGLSDKLIIAAIKKAALKSAGWEYVEGILKNCLSRGITTAEEMGRQQKPATKSDNDFGAFDLDLYEQMLNGKD